MLLRYEEIDFEWHKQIKKSEKVCTVTKEVGSQYEQNASLGVFRSKI